MNLEAILTSKLPSLRKRIFVSSSIAVFSVTVIFLLNTTTGFYFPAVTFFSSAFIALYSGIRIGITCAIFLSLVCDYFFIPPIGTVLHSVSDVEHLVINTVLAMLIAFLGSSLRSAFQQVVLYRQEAEQANRSKDLFLAMLSHELRTPLTTILTWSQMLRMGKLGPEKEKYGIEAIERSAFAQGQLIDDLLDITRIHTGKLSLNIQNTDLPKVINAAIDSTILLSNSKSIQIETQIDPSVKVIFADPIRLEQILWNLITNSLKFSGIGGKVWVTANRPVSMNTEQVCIQIHDNGKGIKPEFIPFIFDRFTQGDNSTTRTHGGLGLGLAIVKNLVEMHGGTVSVESPGEGKGSTFTLTFPSKQLEIPPPEKPESTTESQTNLSSLRVLIVEDEASSREALKVMLQSFGAEIITAESAVEGFNLFQKSKPDIIVSDIAMPDEDGYSLIRKIRALDSEMRDTPALALSAYASSEDIQSAYQAGFQSHLSKPVDANKLAIAISTLTKPSALTLNK